MTGSDSTRRFTVRVGDEEWTETQGLGEAGPDDKVFVVDSAPDRVSFGDGTRGRRPSDDADVTVTYRGGGAAGNISVSIATRWPPPDSRFLVELSSGGVRIRGIGGEVEHFAGVKRPSYFHGQLLGAADLQAEQQYLIGRRYLHNRALHGSGVVTGLSVTVSADGSSPSVVVEPGLALDRRGREIELGAPVVVPIGDPGCLQYVIVEYAERETDPVSSSTDGTGTVASRIEEGASIRLSHEALTDDGIVLARLAPDGTGWEIDGAFEPDRCR